MQAVSDIAPTGAETGAAVIMRQTHSGNIWPIRSYFKPKMASYRAVALFFIASTQSSFRGFILPAGLGKTLGLFTLARGSKHMYPSRTPFMAERRLGRGRKDVAVAPAAVSANDNPPAVAPPPVVDTGALGDRLASMEAKLDRFLKVDHQDIERIQVEIADIAGRIQSTKVEIAALRHPLEKNGKLETAAAELGAVVSDTERATNGIMNNVEKIEDIIAEVIAVLPPGFGASRLADARDHIVKIYEACNFQDITGQRINKVVRTIAFIEERVTAMLGLWNANELAAMPMAPHLDRIDGGLELTGPAGAAGSPTVSQDDIDALFA
jgi:chemotaxis protein CheZ